MNKTDYDHPNYVALVNGKHMFKPFRGDEPKPEQPEAFWRESVLEHEERKAIFAQYEAATVEWSQAKYRHTVTPLIKPALAAWTKYKTAKATVTEIYDGFRTEKDGAWNARVMRLIEARNVALAAAREYENGHERALAVALDEHQEEVNSVDDPWISLNLGSVASTAGIDIGDMDPGSASAEYWKEAGDERVYALERMFREQDAMLAEVKALAG